MTLRKLDALVHEHFGQFPNAESYIRFASSNMPHLYALTLFAGLLSIPSLIGARRLLSVLLNHYFSSSRSLYLRKTPITSRAKKPSGLNISNSSITERSICTESSIAPLYYLYHPRKKDSSENHGSHTKMS